MHDTANTIKEKLANITYSLKQTLFGWTSDCCGDYWGSCFLGDPKDDTKIAWGYYFAIALMLATFGVGVSLVGLQLQMVANCDDNLGAIQDLEQNVKTAMAQQAKNPNASVPVSLPVSCKGWADQCLLVGTTLNLKQYLQYRMGAYVLLLLPFLYLPFMIILYMSATVTDITNLLSSMILNQFQDAYSEQHRESNEKRSQRDPKKLFSGEERDISGALSRMVARMDKEGHSMVLNMLFFFFHGIMGGVALFYDASLYMTVNTSDDGGKMCKQYQDHINSMNKSQLTLDFRFL